MKRASYTVGQLSELAGISTRALRYYEDQGLLSPHRKENGYRIYSESDARKLAQIISMRSCGLSVSVIRSVFENPKTDLHEALCSHLASLHKQRGSLEGAIERTRSAIEAIERMEGMDAKTAFEKMKADELEKNETVFGKEARDRYGDQAVDATNKRLIDLSRDEWDAKELLEDSIKVQLRIARETKDVLGEEAQELARMHAKWLRIHWGESYSVETHLALAQGYLADERFVAYYDNAAGAGATQFLVDVLEANLR